ncbi:hypothetical protein [Butyricicoccus sp.]|uniref:hypothetical protein n=1 Tax=Butyricicoccus sp. TaxID=2049021 RepID=UPI003D7D0EC9
MFKINTKTGETEKRSLLDLMEGGIKELADRDLQRVLDNLKDVNTDPKKARSISVKFTLTSDDNRDAVNVRVQVDSKLAPVKPQETVLDIGYDSGSVAAVERPKVTPGQMRLDDTSNVTPIKARA